MQHRGISPNLLAGCRPIEEADALPVVEARDAAAAVDDVALLALANRELVCDAHQTRGEALDGLKLGALLVALGLRGAPRLGVCNGGAQNGARSGDVRLALRLERLDQIRGDRRNRLIRLGRHSDKEESREVAQLRLELEQLRVEGLEVRRDGGECGVVFGDVVKGRRRDMSPQVGGGGEVVVSKAR